MNTVDAWVGKDVVKVAGGLGIRCVGKCGPDRIFGRVAQGQATNSRMILVNWYKCPAKSQTNDRDVHFTLS